MSQRMELCHDSYNKYIRLEMLNGIAVIFLLLHVRSAHPCSNLSLSISPISSWNFYSGESQPVNLSCSWIRPRTAEAVTDVVFSLRVIEIDANPQHWSNELIFQQEDKAILVVADLDQRSWTFDGSMSLTILFRAKAPLSPSNSLNIRRFLLDWWVITRSSPLVCRSMEIWCLSSPRQRPGLCLPREHNSICLHSTRSFPCDTILVDENERGEIFVRPSTVRTRCFVIVAKDPRHRIELHVHQLAHLDVSMIDGNEFPTRLSTLGEHSVQSDLLIIAVQNANDESAFNLTWSISPCPKNAQPCRETFEQQCYTEQQRCDGIWQCSSGEDELGCSTKVCPNSFSCNSTASDRPHCYPLAERCNGNAFCANHADEQGCSPWWCNSKNGTFLCKNHRCIYEVWTCDGVNDCGDRSDEQGCHSPLPRRLITASVIGGTICSTLFVLVLGFACKLFHLHSSPRHNPRHLLEHASRHAAPPSYNQTIGVIDPNEERYVPLVDNLRQAGLADLIRLEGATRPAIPSEVEVRQGELPPAYSDDDDSDEKMLIA